jgi:hypothetical protein
MWFTYIHGWATDVFSVRPPRGYVSGTEPNKIVIPYGGGAEYLHRSPASRRKRRKENLDSETVKYGRESRRTGNRE